jgi:hypothetical protein
VKAGLRLGLSELSLRNCGMGAGCLRKYFRRTGSSVLHCPLATATGPLARLTAPQTQGHHAKVSARHLKHKARGCAPPGHLPLDDSFAVLPYIVHV